MVTVPHYITKSVFEVALQDYLRNKNVKVLNYACEMVVAPSESYNSNILRSNITYSTGLNGNHETISVIIKCCPKADANQLFEVTNDMKFFEREIKMYTEILPEVHEILGGLEILSAKNIGVDDGPVRKIILEDLSVQDFKMSSRQEGLDLEHCKLTVKKIAQLHAASLIIYEKKPEAFSTFHQALYPGNYTISYWIKTGIAEVIKAGSLRPNIEKYTEKLKQIQNKIIEKCTDAAQLRAGFNVLNHGDCWTNNIMFKYSPDEKLVDLRLVDYQIGVFTSPAVDLHYFWAISPNLEVRRQHLYTILDYYYNQLMTTLINLKYNIDKIPTIDEFRKDWFSRSYYGFAAAVTVLALAKVGNRDDASVVTLLEPNETCEGSFRHDVYHNSNYWEHLEYILEFFDKMELFDS